MNPASAEAGFEKAPADRKNDLTNALQANLGEGRLSIDNKKENSHKEYSVKEHKTEFPIK